ncbi:arylesterase [Pseudodesulfovibrio sp.]|uniref:arylesterase n=1 Tax=Pseudodesulfovibrio sp. TaxID=2035812 RepID=UPI00260B410A|nr:arylesterase [Pseudodesulfovibrio sp.]MDD3312182.1 arylesterase [Pseudodesulfovibrio sp.]
MPGPVTIACFGDSLTEGYGLAPDEALPAVLERLLADRGIAARCRNFGVSGDTSADGLERLGAVLDDAPDAALVAFGANDCFLDEPAERVEANLAAIIEAFRERGVPVLLVGIKALLNPDDGYRRRFEAIFPALAERYGLPLFPDILAPYFGNSDLTLMDGTHPNTAGVEAVGRALIPLVADLAQSVGS